MGLRRRLYFPFLYKVARVTGIVDAKLVDPCWIGPIRIDGEATLRWLSASDRRGRRGAEIAGSASRVVVGQLCELVDNDDRKQPVDGTSGVLEEVHFGTSGAPSGHYLLIRCVQEPTARGLDK